MSTILQHLSGLEEDLNTQYGAQMSDHSRAIAQYQTMAREHQAEIKGIEQAVQVCAVCVQVLKATRCRQSLLTPLLPRSRPTQIAFEMKCVPRLSLIHI